MRTNTAPESGYSANSIGDIRRRARQDIESGAVTPAYQADIKQVLRLLNEALATEMVCVLRYRRHFFCAAGVVAEAVKQEFMVHAQQELGHADLLAERIIQLGGEPDFDPATLTGRSHAEYVAGKTLPEMLREDLIAERVAIESYKQFIAFLGALDPTTRRLLEQILAVEEEHAEELASMLQDIGRQAIGPP